MEKGSEVGEVWVGGWAGVVGGLSIRVCSGGLGAEGGVVAEWVDGIAEGARGGSAFGFAEGGEDVVCGDAGEGVSVREVEVLGVGEGGWGGGGCGVGCVWVGGVGVVVWVGEGGV